MRANKLSTYGVAIKMKLLELNQTQSWLVEKANKAVGSNSLDCSFLNRIMTGRVKNSKYIPVINNILGIRYE